MISLLDDHTQFFLSGATNDNINKAQVSLESAQWYGCDQVSHHGGLCERTILLEHQPGAPACYEVLDMAKTERTQILPFVSGKMARFRHYVGMPITSPDNFNIGTVFAMSKSPGTSGISKLQQQYLYDTTKHVMGQLVQGLQALEGKRAERYNEALSSLLGGQAYERHQSRESQIKRAESKRPAEVNEVYNAAGNLLHDFLDLSGLFFQELLLPTRQSRSFSDNAQSTITTSKLGPHMDTVVPLDTNSVYNLLEAFPTGAVLYVDHAGEQPSFVQVMSCNTKFLDAATNASLNQSFPGARQIIFAPLWDTIHNRCTALCIGWVLHDDRILRPETDLNAVSSFCMAIVAIVQRIESQMLEQVKSDFMGSISHETRSPLHNILGNLDLALDGDCSPQLRETLIDARYVGVLLAFICADITSGSARRNSWRLLIKSCSIRGCKNLRLLASPSIFSRTTLHLNQMITKARS